MAAIHSAPVLDDLARTVRSQAWELALRVVEEGLVDDQLPSLQRLGRAGQFSGAAAFRGGAPRLRVSDLAGRMGGDELAAYLVEIDEETVPRLLGRVQDRVDELIELGELPPGTSFSAGSAVLPREAADADGLFRLADSRLYEAKRASTA